MTPPLIYNLFPRLVGPTTQWAEHVREARSMAFNWIYVNPWHYPGFSGSLYAPKYFDRLNPLFLPEGADPASLDPLKAFLQEAEEIGVPVMMDLVVNHTSKDCPLVQTHPNWYVRDERGEVVSPSVTDPNDPSKRTVWGDLAEIDNANSPDRETLWEFWADLVRRSMQMGFAGFRCDAAYMVPAELWRRLIAVAREINPQAAFFAETLGAPVDAVLALREAGFDYFFNSSKWWNFRDSWALDQHESFGRIAPSISFPETHDTTRLAGDTGARESIQRQRYAFAAAFSAGLMMPIGYEYGFQTQVNVVDTMPSDWERSAFDLRPFIRRVNDLKLRSPLLQGEGHFYAPEGLGGDVRVLERRSDDHRVRGFILVNMNSDADADFDCRRLGADLPNLKLVQICRDEAPGAGEPLTAQVLRLRPAEVVYLLPDEGLDQF